MLEQPAHSRLFKAASLPMPGTNDGDLWTLHVWQAWWGYGTRKATWLCFNRVEPDSISLPFKLHDQGFDRRRFAVMSKNQRSATCETFARFLVDAAKRAA